MEKIKWIEEVIERAMESAWMGDHERALEWLTPLLFDEPGYGRLHLALGDVYSRYADEPVHAERHYRMAIRFDPSLTAAYDGLVAILREDERHDETIAVCGSGLKVKRVNRSELLGMIGEAWELKEKFRKAIQHYRKALRHSAALYRCLVLEESIKRCKRKQR